ncbi:hypothetical protein RZN25_16640, partial [Bacillaceae bacterium S4-13-56]
MNNMNLLLMIGVYCSLLVFSSRYFYILDIKFFGKKIMKALQLNVLELNYSFEQMVYFYSLPSSIPVLKYADKNDISIGFDYDSLLFRHLKGIKIYVSHGNEKVVLAYLSANDFRLPSLDLLLEEGKLDEDSYLKISIFKLIHPNTLEEITDEVFKQVQVGRYKNRVGGDGSCQHTQT